MAYSADDPDDADKPDDLDESDKSGSALGSLGQKRKGALIRDMDCGLAADSLSVQLANPRFATIRVKLNMVAKMLHFFKLRNLPPHESMA